MLIISVLSYHTVMEDALMDWSIKSLKSFLKVCVEVESSLSFCSDVPGFSFPLMCVTGSLKVQCAKFS